MHHVRIVRRDRLFPFVPPHSVKESTAPTTNPRPPRGNNGVAKKELRSEGIVVVECGGRATLQCHHVDEGAFTGDLLRKLV